MVEIPYQELRKLQARLKELENANSERTREEGRIQLQSQILEIMAEGVNLVRASDGIIVYTSPGFDQMFGYEPGELVGIHISVINALTENNPQDVAAEISNVLNKKGEWIGEIYNVRKDGTKFWCSVNIKAFQHPEHGKVWISVHTDINERKLAEEKLKDSEEKFRSTFELAAVGVAQAGTDGRFLHLNQKFCDIVGYTRDELIEKTFQDITYPDDLSLDLEQASRLLAGEIPSYSMEKRYIRKDGTQVWVNLTGSIVRGNSRINDYFVAIVEDITERKKMEVKLRQSEELFSKAFHASPVAISITTSPEGRIIDVNDSFIRIMGFSRDEVIGHIQHEFDPPKNVTVPELNRMLREGVSIRNIEMQFITRNGVKRDALMSFETIELNGEDCILSMGMDITERKHVEEELTKSKQLLERTFLSLSDAVFIIDSETAKIIDCNKAASKIFGYEKDEMVGRITSFLHLDEEALAEFRKKLYAAEKETGFLFLPEFRMKRKNGECFFTEHTVTTFQDDTGKRLGWVSFVRDITEIKGAEKALRKSEEKFRSIFEQSPIAIELYDREGNLIDANRSCLDLFGINDIKSVIGFKLFEDPNIAEDKKKRLSNGESIEFESVFDYELVKKARLYETTKSGKCYLDILIVPLMTEERERYGYLVHLKDISERKRAEEALRESEGRLKRAHKAAQLGNWEWDLVTNELYWAEENYRIHGIDSQKVKPSYEAFINVIDPAEHEYVNKAVADALTGKRPFEIDYTVIRPDNGEKCVINSKADVIVDSTGKTVKMVGTVQDITERKRTEEKLQIALIKYKTLFSAFPLGITVADRTGKILETNRMAERLLGLSQEEQRQRKIDGQEWTIVRTDGTPLPADEYASVRALRENRIVENMEMGIVKKPGEITWINVTASPLPLDEGGVVITYNDITWRKQAEAKMHSLNQTLEAAQNMAKVGYWSYDIKTKMPAWSEQMFVIFGIDPGKGVPHFDEHRKIWHPDDWDMFKTSVQECEKGKPYNIIVRIIFPDKSIHYINTQGFPRYNEKSEIYELFGTSQEITELKRNEEKIKNSLKEKEILLKEIHHRVKNNLQVISSLLYLQSRKLSDAQSLEVFNEGQNRIRSMVLIHEQLYRSSDLAKIDFEKYIYDITYSLAHSYGSKPVNYIIQAEGVYLGVDQAIPCGLIINELISNALKHAFPQGKQGRIDIDFRIDNSNYLTLTIKDNGIGFPKDLDFQNTTSLGLQIVNKLVNQLEGTIELHKNAGTEFIIKFPAQNKIK